ncbi:universal stress protein [uncultured Psychroserpens sp.]|uniref:universal stress protein n=1 Tax=uncultured Psychroserpens sp. TaxID=255436 RepID=UPI00260C7900|nr:universal stress protein [uncultured Psychroserpens sp.]
MKKIILLTDFSDNALDAIHYSMRFFSSEKCIFYLMHVHKAGSFISDDLMTSSSESIYESITKAPREKLNTLAENLKKQYNNSNHTFGIIIDFDVFTDAVNQAIKTYDIDIVIMGSNGISGVKEVIFGSNTLNVIRGVICKTLIIPNNYMFKPAKNFLLPLQDKDIINEEQINLVNEFTKKQQLKLHVLRVCSKEKIVETIRTDNSKLNTTSCNYNIESSKFFDAVIDYLEVHDIDLMGLIVHDKSFIERLFTESPTIKLSKVIKLPLLIFHSSEH